MEEDENKVKKVLAKDAPKDAEKKNEDTLYVANAENEDEKKTLDDSHLNASANKSSID